MSVRVWASPYRHWAERPDPTDSRLAFTRCGLRFAWTDHWPGDKPALSDCPECFA